ncbi:hemolysin family protein [Allosphingosinicella indica]|uniref:Putative hemolysin n=1 Tax=Allosphingosinicella indica TaxID=941907 RepID=A0A1X7G1B2_9SPHN|nr:hemolysin family protein [Allosphingosinicella indica]SMF61777.1 putative hemolysin [Allosphingosinicella indica]
MPSAPSPFPWFDVVIILLLVGLNGLFAMSELAVVSARRPRLKAMAKSGKAGANAALALGANPGRFLSTVQIGITLIGIIAGAYSGASLGGPTGERIAALGVPAELSRTLGLAVVIGLTTYASLIIGELVPKQFALRAPEPIACLVARPMQWLAKATAPLVWLLDKSSGAIFRLFGLSRESESKVTAEELHLVVAEATTAGVLEESERAIISGVVRLADRPTREVMTPRTDVDWIDASADAETIRQCLLDTPHSRLPVAEGSVDRLVGVVQSRDIVEALLEGKALDLRELMREAPVVHDRADAMDALVALRAAEVPMAFVHDEYGHFEGVVTPADLMAALAGAFASDTDIDTDPPLVERDDGSWWVSGSVSADTMADELGIDLPGDRDYATAAGFALSVLKRIPEVGEHFNFAGWRFEISDMDGRKIDKMLAAEVARKRRA